MTLAAGALAPEITGGGVNTHGRRLADLLRRGPVILAIGKSTCATCELAFPYLQRLREAYPDDSWSLVALLQDTPADARQFARRLGLSFSILSETEPYAVSQAYDPEATPTTFLIDADGRIADGCAAFSKAGLNKLAAELAERIDKAPVEIAPSGDGKPAFRPG